MKRISYIYTALGLMLIAVSASAQQRVINGYVMTRSTFGASDMVNLSQYNNSTYGTARSVAMGGAFTSLGADLSSMNINPAGLGMYRSSEFGFTPAMTMGEMESRSYNGMMSDSRSRFSINNLGVALNVYEGTGDITSFTFGFSYNKIADFNYRSTSSMPTDNVTIAEIFQNQLRGIDSKYIDFDTSDPFMDMGIPINMWGSILAYNSWMVGTDPSTANDVYLINGMDENTGKSHQLNTYSKGSIGEYSISAGINIRNKVYLGMTIGIQDVNIEQEIGYYERYSNSIAPDPIANFTSMQYHQFTNLSGAGVDFKFGAIIRPIEQLRVGIAVHTPKLYSIDMKYGAGMGAVLDNGGRPIKSSIWALSNYKFNSPTRLMMGVSYTILKRAIVSVDYERTWYNGMKLKGNVDADHKTDTNSAIKSEFKGANTFRAGVEFMATNSIALRAGFAYMDTPLKGDNFARSSNYKTYNNTPVATETYNISGGVGFELGRVVSLDLTYSYVDTKYTGYEMLNYRGPDNIGTEVSIHLGRSGDQIKQSLSRHNIMGSLIFRF